MSNSKFQEPVVFQFSHPGREHAVSKKNIISDKMFFKIWNTQVKGEGTTHARKFLHSKGNYVSKDGKLVENAELNFWGEWEPDSIAIDLRDEPNEYGRKLPGVIPEFVHFPVLLPFPTVQIDDSVSLPLQNVLKKRKEKLESCALCVREGQLYRQNTDPYVFGTHFIYSICKQNQLEDIKPGSIILFGSNSRKYPEHRDEKGVFMVDTVFVVKDVIENMTKKELNALDKRFSGQYKEVVLNPLYEYDETVNHKLFIGATYNDTVNGMYSFVPAKNESHNLPSKRLFISKDDKDFANITVNINSQGSIKYSGEKEVKSFWENMLKLTYKNNYVPAVYFDEPSMIDALQLDKLIQTL